MRTAVGAPVAPYFLRSIKRLDSQIRIIGLDCDPLAVGFSFSDKAHVVPRATEASYIPTLLELSRKEKVDWFIPDLEEEFLPILQAKEAFQRVGTRILLSSKETIETCLDKWKLYQFFRRHHIPTPHTSIASNEPPSRFPVFLKPRFGRGSQHAYPVFSEEAYRFYLPQVPEPLVQTYLTGQEITIDAFSDQEGNFCYCAMRKRLQTESGISIKGETFYDPSIEEWVKNIVEALRIIGPSCLQGFIDQKGAIVFTEVNPRIGGGFALSVAAGAPILEDILRLLKGIPPHDQVRVRQGVRMVRYWESLFFEDENPCL